VVINATGCLEVGTTRYPTTAWNVPWLHVAFENASAAASGVEAAYRSLLRRGTLPGKERITFVVFGGDGGTYDIGLQSLSGALERGHRFLYVCYDNQAYMNTGVQRSGATPFGTSTSTSPSGTASFGKQQNRKDLTAIVVAHRVPYAGQAAISHWQDLSQKVGRATAVDGPSFLNVLTTCQLGWGHPARDSVRIARLAVDTCVWPLFEVVDGHYRLTYRPRAVPPVVDWLKEQRRFKHLSTPENAPHVGTIQRGVDEEWSRLLERCRHDEAWFASHDELGPLGVDS
jgi:pyruvate ferredoxin oxidoreductase beta subunit